jgi:hypothetical protein
MQRVVPAHPPIHFNSGHAFLGVRALERTDQTLAENGRRIDHGILKEKAQKGIS